MTFIIAHKIHFLNLIKQIGNKAIEIAFLSLFQKFKSIKS